MCTQSDSSGLIVIVKILWQQLFLKSKMFVMQTTSLPSHVSLGNLINRKTYLVICIPRIGLELACN